MKKVFPTNRLINFKNINNPSESYYLILSDKCSKNYLDSVLASLFTNFYQNVEIQYLDPNNKVVGINEVLSKGSIFYVLTIRSNTSQGYEDVDYILKNNIVNVLTESEYLRSSNDINLVSITEKIKSYEKAEMETFKKIEDKNRDFLIKSNNFQTKANNQAKDFMMKTKQMKEIYEELRLISDQMENARKTVEKKCNILL